MGPLALRPAAGDARNGATRRGAVQRGERTARFFVMFRNPIFSTPGRRHCRQPHPDDELVAVSPVILIDAGG